MKASRREGLGSSALVGLVIAILVVAGVAYVALAGTGSHASSSTSTTGASTSAPPTSTSSSSVSALATTEVSSSASQSCAITSTGANVSAPSPIPLLTAYNSQTVSYSDTSEGVTANATEAFNVVYRSPTTYKVMTTFNETGADSSIVYTSWILKNGTALAIYVSVDGGGVNETGASANSLIEGAFAGFYGEIEFGQDQGAFAADSQYFHSTGTSVATVGENQVTVTTYVPNNPDEAATVCGSQYSFTTFSLTIGTPTGASSPIVTDLDFVGSTTVGGSTEPINFTLQTTDFTVA